MYGRIEFIPEYNLFLADQNMVKNVHQKDKMVDKIEVVLPQNVVVVFDYFSG